MTVELPSRTVAMQRVLVVGTSGSGKTTFAGELARSLGSDYAELDALFWGPDWTPKPREEFVDSLRRAIAGERWVVDGNYGSIRDILWPRATDIVWLNYPFVTAFSRVLRRTIRRARSGEALWQGNRESLARAFLMRDSILWWTITTHRRRRREFARLKRDDTYPHIQWHEVRKPIEAERLLASAVPSD
jgi:adenylate kinase family enzyme